MENLKEAHKNARKDKLFYREVKMVDSDPEYYLTQIHEMLKNEIYTVSPYVTSTIIDKGKERELNKLPYYPDRIIQWAIMLQVEDIFMQTFCYHTCASIKKRGIKAAYRQTTKILKNREDTAYCLKIDVSKFYPNINHEILKKLLRKKFKDKKLLNLLDIIIDSYKEDKGVPIGSYLSQFLANFYLTYFDHWLKEDRKRKYVVRFMDDVTIYGKTGAEMHQLMDEIAEYMKNELDLKVKDNWQVFPTAVRGVDFVGYRFFYDFILLRKTTCRKFKKRMIVIKDKLEQGRLISYSDWCSANSYAGWLHWCDSWRLFEKYVEPVIQGLVMYYRCIIIKDASTERQDRLADKYYNKLIKKKGRKAA
jgi:hypothetical protein